MSSTSTATLVRQRNAAATNNNADNNLKQTSKDVEGRVPTNLPPFTLGDIRRAIPTHCFERSLIKSYSYILIDSAAIAAAVYGASNISAINNVTIRGLLWVIYWVIAGSFGTGLWVIGHECGHGGFANSAMGNNVPGFILHTFLLVPYFAWQISHRKHHSNTGNLDADEVFVPSFTNISDQEDEPASFNYTIEAINRFVNIVKMLTLGWPIYLAFNVTAHQNYPKDRWVSHFNPYSPIFSPSDAKLIMVSDVGLLAMLASIAYACYIYSFQTVLFYYGVPYLIVNLFLVLITFLQHTDLKLPHYNGKEWDWLRGALATVDRDYGIWNIILHHITDTHVVHHLFSSMPHYHALEATQAVKPILKEYYAYDDTPVPIAVWKIFGRCNVVKPENPNSGIYWY